MRDRTLQNWINPPPPVHPDCPTCGRPADYYPSWVRPAACRYCDDPASHDPVFCDRDNFPREMHESNIPWETRVLLAHRAAIMDLHRIIRDLSRISGISGIMEQEGNTLHGTGHKRPENSRESTTPAATTDSSRERTCPVCAVCQLRHR